MLLTKQILEFFFENFLKDNIKKRLKDLQENSPQFLVLLSVLNEIEKRGKKLYLSDLSENQRIIITEKQPELLILATLLNEVSSQREKDSSELSEHQSDLLIRLCKSRLKEDKTNKFNSTLFSLLQALEKNQNNEVVLIDKMIKKTNDLYKNKKKGQLSPSEVKNQKKQEEKFNQTLETLNLPDANSIETLFQKGLSSFLFDIFTLTKNPLERKALSNFVKTHSQKLDKNTLSLLLKILPYLCGKDNFSDNLRMIDYQIVIKQTEKEQTAYLNTLLDNMETLLKLDKNFFVDNPALLKGMLRGEQKEFSILEKTKVKDILNDCFKKYNAKNIDKLTDICCLLLSLTLTKTNMELKNKHLFSEEQIIEQMLEFFSYILEELFSEKPDLTDTNFLYYVSLIVTAVSKGFMSLVTVTEKKLIRPFSDPIELLDALEKLKNKNLFNVHHEALLLSEWKKTFILLVKKLNDDDLLNEKQLENFLNIYLFSKKSCLSSSPIDSLQIVDQLKKRNLLCEKNLDAIKKATDNQDKSIILINRHLLAIALENEDQENFSQEKFTKFITSSSWKKEKSTVEHKTNNKAKEKKIKKVQIKFEETETYERKLRQILERRCFIQGEKLNAEQMLIIAKEILKILFKPSAHETNDFTALSKISLGSISPKNIVVSLSYERNVMEVKNVKFCDLPFQETTHVPTLFHELEVKHVASILRNLEFILREIAFSITNTLEETQIDEEVANKIKAVVNQLKTLADSEIVPCQHTVAEMIETLNSPLKENESLHIETSIN